MCPIIPQEVDPPYTPPRGLGPHRWRMIEVGSEDSGYVPTPIGEIPPQGFVIEFPECGPAEAAVMALNAVRFMNIKTGLAQGPTVVVKRIADDPEYVAQRFMAWLSRLADQIPGLFNATLRQVGIRIRKPDGQHHDIADQRYASHARNELAGWLKPFAPPTPEEVKQQAAARRDYATLLLAAYDYEARRHLLYAADEKPGLIWVDWREAHKDIVTFVAKSLRLEPGALAFRSQDGSFFIDYYNQFTPVPLVLEPGEQDKTLLALNLALGKHYEIRFIAASSGSDTLAFLVLDVADWPLVESKTGIDIDHVFHRLDGTPLFSG